MTKSKRIKEGFPEEVIFKLSLRGKLEEERLLDKMNSLCGLPPKIQKSMGRLRIQSRH